MNLQLTCIMNLKLTCIMNYWTPCCNKLVVIFNASLVIIRRYCNTAYIKHMIGSLLVSLFMHTIGCSQASVRYPVYNNRKH